MIEHLDGGAHNRYMLVSVRVNHGNPNKGPGADEQTQFLETFSLGSALYLAAGQLSTYLESDPKLVECLWSRIMEPSGPTGALVVFALFASRDEVFLIAEFIQGETIPELAQRCDPASYQQRIPMFRRVFDAFEGMKNGHPVGSDSLAMSVAGIRAGHLELIELGIAQIGTTAIVGFGRTKLHGFVVVTPTRLVGARVFSETQEETHILDAASVQLYQSLATWVSTGTPRRRASDQVVFWCLSDLRSQPLMTAAPERVVPHPPIGMSSGPNATRSHRQ